jgi:hypothetical protein
VLRTRRGPLRIALRAALRDSTGAVTRRTARSRLR